MSDTLSRLLDPAEIALVREDLARWRAIYDKGAINVILAGKRPDGTPDVSRRESLGRLLAVVEQLFDEHAAAQKLGG